MATLIHITRRENEKSIKNSGIKLNNYNVIYFMPHTPDFLISHQWMRELKRFGIKNHMAVDFKLPNEELVWMGNYHSAHRQLPLGEAIGEFMKAEDKFGYEFFIQRKIEPKEIKKFRYIPKPMGWRYEPNAHGKPPCPCPMCIQRGGYKTNKLKEDFSPEITREEAFKIIATSNKCEELADAIFRLQGKWRKESPEYLARLLEVKDELVHWGLAQLLSEYRHPLAKEYLQILANSPYEDVSELAQEYLAKK